MNDRSAPHEGAPEATTTLPDHTADTPDSLVTDAFRGAIAARRLHRAGTTFNVRQLRRQRRNSRACQMACLLADGADAAATSGAKAPDVMRRLDPDQRIAQLDHARRHGFQSWEIAQLVPAPVTADERARVAG